MSGNTHLINLPPLCLDLKEERLWNEEQLVELRPKTWALICYMTERPNELLSKRELIDAVWPDTIVTEASLNQAIRELRKALGDDARSPRFIETVHRRGFRFIGASEQSSQVTTPTSVHQAPSRSQLFGRHRELTQLNEYLERAKEGKPQVLFVTGEAGIGKTVLVRTFLDSLSSSPGDKPVLIGCGRCIDQHGESEAYLPILDVIDRLARGPQAERVQQSLKHYAPTWFVQFSWMQDSEYSFDQQLMGVTPGRMLREFCVFIEALTAQIPLVLWLEDLHWSDSGTIDLLNALSRREENTRLFVIASYRPVDAAINGHPVARLKQSLLRHDFAVELALELLEHTAVEAYLTSRFDKLDMLTRLTELVIEQTDGNPLFVITLVDYLVANGLLEKVQNHWKFTATYESISAECPKSLKEIVEMQKSAANNEQTNLLDAASVVGTVFDAQAVAGALELSVQKVETVFGQLAIRGQFLTVVGAANWPDGSQGQRYEFIHDVFRSVLYNALPPGKCQKLHRCIAQRLSKGFADQHESVAAELALHSELGGDLDGAIDFLILAAGKAQQRSAETAVSHLKRALKLLAKFPQNKEIERRELKLHLLLMRAMLPAMGYTTIQMDSNIARALELCDRLDDKTSQLLVLSFQSSASVLRGNLAITKQIIEVAKSIEVHVSDPIFLSHRQLISGVLALVVGEHKSAEKYFKQCESLLDDTEMRLPSMIFGHDPTVLAMGFSSICAWILGFPDEARVRAIRCRRRSQAVGGALSVANGFDLSLSVEQFRRDFEAARQFADSLKACTEKFGVAYNYMRPVAGRNWLLIQAGDATKAVSVLTQDIASAQENNARLFSSLSLTTLAEAHLANGTTTKGLAISDEALEIAKGGERVWEAETYRIKGELLRLENQDSAAEECFRKSLKVAASQSALSLELRGATSLANLMAENGRKSEARQLLEKTLCRFTEGLESADLQDANSLLNTL